MSQELFEELGVDFQTSGKHSTQGWIQLRDCPSCGSSNYHLGFNLRARFFSCWKCGGLKTDYVLKELGATPEQRREFWKGSDLPVEKRSRPQGSLKEPKHRGPLLKPHVRYLEERGLDPQQMQTLWEVEGIGVAGLLSWRIYVPIVQAGKRVSWTSRAIGSRQPRYFSAGAHEESVPHKDCVYGIDFARHSIVIVEGPADVWKVGPGAVALFGTAYTPAQVRALSRFPFRYILFDNETTAQLQARKLAAQLSCFPGTTSILECDAKDPGELPAREIQRLRRIARLERM